MIDTFAAAKRYRKAPLGVAENLAANEHLGLVALFKALRDALKIPRSHRAPAPKHPAKIAHPAP
jgi:hypothetical protein